MDQEIENLKTLYARTSKHSNYQILPECLKPLLDETEIDVKSRFERERLDYILQYINPNGKSILDIGGNSGYFSFELIDRGAKHVDYYEGNKTHSEFVLRAAELLNCSDKLIVYNEYINFRESCHDRHYDVVFLLNVLHHVGDDYDEKDLTLLKAKQKIIESVNALAGKTSSMIFQLGFCWKGNRDFLLFKNGTKEEMIDFISENTKEFWEITDIGIPVLGGGKVSYNNLNQDNIKRDDKLGEFLNRPIFVLKSKK